MVVFFSNYVFCFFLSSLIQFFLPLHNGHILKGDGNINLLIFVEEICNLLTNGPVSVFFFSLIERLMCVYIMYLLLTLVNIRGKI